jgi:L-ascorbate metabolism protein UlaG (beta-lactamase superfamily)
VRFEDLPDISTVLLSHNHYDHCDLRTLALLAKRFDPLVVAPLGNAPLVRSAGMILFRLRFLEDASRTR